MEGIRSKMDLPSNREKCYIYIDGGCWPNPGGDMYYAYSIFHSPINGFVVRDNIVSLFMDNGAIEYGVGYAYDKSVESSNNVAEYIALLNALNSRKIWNDEVTILSDSLMLVKQMSKEYKVREGRYKEIFDRCCQTLKSIAAFGGLVDIKFEYIPRESNISGVALEIFREKFYHS